MHRVQMVCSLPTVIRQRELERNSRDIGAANCAGYNQIGLTSVVRAAFLVEWHNELKLAAFGVDDSISVE